MEELCVSRYATLPELYVRMAAQMGHFIDDVQSEEAQYALYIAHKKAARKEKSKKLKEKSKDKDEVTFTLPPRLWTVRRGQRRHVLEIDRMLFPIPGKTDAAKDETSTETGENDGE